MYKTSDEFQHAAQELLKMVERHDRGELSTHTLLFHWKMFYKLGSEYLNTLRGQVDSNPNWS